MIIDSLIESYAFRNNIYISIMSIQFQSLLDFQVSVLIDHKDAFVLLELRPLFESSL